MTKKIRNLIIGAVILVFLGAVLAVLLSTQGDGEADASSLSYGAEDIVLMDKKDTDVASLQVKNKLDSYLITRGEDDRFTIEEMKDYSQNFNYYSMAAIRAAGLTAVKEVETTLDNVAKYGLDNPQAEVTVTFEDQSEFTFFVGNPAPSDKGYYLRVKGKDSVYISSENMAGSFLQPRTAYVDPTINLPENVDDAPDITEMSIARSDLEKPIVFTKGEAVSTNDPLASMKSDYQLISPFHSAIDKEKGEAQIATFFTLTADEVVALAPNEEQLKEYGFDKPTMTVTVQSSDGETHKLTAGKGIYCDEDPSEVEEGHKHEIVYYYLMYDNKNVVYKLTASTLSWMTLKTEDVVSKYILTPMITDVSSIDVTVDGKSYTMNLTHQTVQSSESGGTDNEDLASALVNGQSVSNTNFKMFYQFLIQVTVDSLVTTPPSESPRMTITYHYKSSLNKQDDVLQFVPYGERKVAVVVNGEANFVTRSAYVDRAVENLEKIASDLVINPNW